MNRRRVLIASFVVSCSLSVFAQHPQGHPQGPPHDSGSHQPMDPKLHAAMHAMLVGNWAGTITGSDGAAARLSLTATQDKQGQVALKLASARSLRVGTARDINLADHAVQWTQELGGATCKATGKLTDTSTHGVPKMAGTLACGHTEIPFALEKSTK